MRSCADMKRILCPVDVSNFSYDTVENAVFLAQQLGGEVLFLHVINERMFEGIKRASGRIHALDDVYEQALQGVQEERAEAFARFLEECKASRVPHRTEIKLGIPWQVILQEAEQGGFGLIVMGTKGRGSRSKHLRFGSTAEKVFRRAPCRVMFVR